ncbi:BgTH12-02892 [Blumeria graminis f. sp. triticale]|uniref:DNA 3'-5' helicase n=3 Tax=Blumeria graminis TaxID=34373 RepID=A0A9X9MIG3_BLUGR|nr:hypothetical protein BGT96224_A21118 [Blumeria graminis f. sp. tritici 96224]CAD6503225.1 BgTH12-02892 [Blumeria graminis f. sp. triticale]VDB89199.1 BgtA-21118 [Blumeria graminis f. sp. tritici]
MRQQLTVSNLNQSQRAAVTSAHDQLSILAGPGSGKTHTLASRTAWLLAQGLQPRNVIVTTFTVKAAREMKERIGRLVGTSESSKLILGTFHSITRRYLAQYGYLIEIRNNFGIADSADSLAIIKRIVKRHEFNIDPKAARSRISGIKARGGDRKHSKNISSATALSTQEFEICFQEYEEALCRSNLLDYDDLLLKCVDLLVKHPECVANVEAVLVDEFQDTNIVQFRLMQLFSSYRKRVTIVGDPDQSIYSFRAAEIKNYERMQQYYPESVTIALEENYRSSGAILLSALSVIEQDSSRAVKSLLPTHAVGTRPVVRQLPDAHTEAEWITSEIQRIVGVTGGLLELSDFSILLRSAALSRLIETALGKAGLSYRMIGGVRFYDRVEIKIILDYLRVIDQPDNNDALSRIINVPSRKIGETTIKRLLEEADRSKKTLWSLVIGVVQGKRVQNIKLTKQAEQGLSSFCDIILTARNKNSCSEDIAPSILDLLRYVLKKLKYEDWLEKHYDDNHKARWSNVEELMMQVTEFQNSLQDGYDEDSLPLLDDVQQNGKVNYLSKFLANVALASEVKMDENGANQIPQITLSTIHAAKGLEWPVVFIPAAYQGSIPHSRSEDSDEERRLLYVAMTRAKALLYLSRPIKSSHGETTQLSPFLPSNTLKFLMDQRGPEIQSDVIQSISQILRRPLPSPDIIAKSSLYLQSVFDNIYPLFDQNNEEDFKSNFFSGIRNNTSDINKQGFKRRCVSTNGSNLCDDREISLKASKSICSAAPGCASISSISLQKSSTGFIRASKHHGSLEEKCNSSVANATYLPGYLDYATSSGMLPSKDKESTPGSQQSLHKFFKKSTSVSSKVTVINHTMESDQTIKNKDELCDGEFPEIHLRSNPNLQSSTVKWEQNQNNILPSSSIKYDMLESKKSKIIHNSLASSNSSSTFHCNGQETTMELLNQPLTTGKKTLGVKRSMNGWSSRKEFTLPTSKRKM